MTMTAAPEPGTDVLALIEEQLAAARQAEADEQAVREVEALRSIEALAAGLRWDLAAQAAADATGDADRIASVLDAVWAAPGDGSAP